MPTRLDRDEFAARLRTQLRARYHDVEIEVESGAFALRLTAAGIDSTLPLTPLLNACERDPERTATLIADFVRRTESQLTPRTGTELALTRLLWCVRSTAYMRQVGRRDELMRRDLGGGLLAFVAEELPGSVMRGVPETEWRERDITDDAVRAAADANTQARFEPLVARIQATDRVPADGWRVASDVLFQGSALLAPAVLAALAERVGGAVLLANPDRNVLLALPATAAAARTFSLRAVREWREAMNPVSREVFVTDGRELRPVARKGSVLMPWLAE